MKNKPKLYTIVYVVCGAAIALLFVYLLLDFFVIPRARDVEPVKIVVNTPAPQTTEPSSTGGGMQEYDDDSSEDTAGFFDLFGTPSSSAPEETPKGGETDDHAETDTGSSGTGASPQDEKTLTPGASETSGNDETPALDETPEPTVFVSEDEYHSEDVDIVITKYRKHDTDIYVADVVVRDAFLLRAAFAKNTYGKNIIETTSQQAKNNHAILAINGDFYGRREKGYVVRNGEAWRMVASGRSERNTKDDLAVLQDGSFRLFSENDTTFDEVASWGPWQVFSFGPAILKDGAAVVGSGDDVKDHLSSNPRTVIAEVSPLHYMFVVSDGRTGTNKGLSLLQLAEFLRSLGAKNAYNFDGGGSTAMYFNGKIINKPVNNGTITERFVSDIVYIPE